ncbi:MAG: N-acetyltransferase [Slackia sp.]|nr:N-acetyltransferase [Slackia sp.]
MTNIRIAYPHEFDRIAALYDEMIADMAHSAFDPHWNRDEHPGDDFLKSALDQGQIIVCEHDGEFAGALVLNREGADGYEGTPWNVSAADGEASIIHVLCTLPRLQGNGLARALLRGALDIARNRGDRCVRLDVLPDNLPAQKLYESEGFVRIRETVLHYPDGSFDSILYECPLE